MKKKKNLVLVLVVSLLLGVAGCGNKDDLAENTLIYGSGDYTAINPALFEHGEINSLIFAGLTAHDKDNNVVPALAESWTYDEASLTYTFKLKDGLTFHDGHQLTSHDVKFTLESIVDEKNQSEIISNYQDIYEINCIDELTVEIKLARENIAFPDYMTIGILPKHLLEGKDLTTDSFNQNPIGAGPYKLVSWDMGQSISLERFDNYYDGMANIEKIIFKIIPNSDSRALAIAAGEIHMAQITAKTAEGLRNDDRFNVYQMETADYRAIAYNFASDFFGKHKELPNILSYGIDRKAIIESVLLGEGQYAYSPIQKNAYAYADMEKFEYDPQKTRMLLEEAGWSMGKSGYYEKDGEELSFEICAMSNDQVRVDMAMVCAAQLQELGVNAKAISMPSLDWANQDSCIIGWGSPFDADDHTYKIFTTDAGDNYTAYSNKNVDELLLEARACKDEEKRKALYEDFQKEIAKDMPYTFIAYIDADYCVNKAVKGITPETVLGHHGVGIFWNVADWTMQ